jgi:DNA-binding transcriptional ArsR family regulator
MIELKRTPSDDPAELRDQLLRELSRLDEPRPEEPELFRAYVQHAQVLAWQGVADGWMDAPHEALSCLEAAQPFVDRNRPDLAPPAAAAVEIEVVRRSLYLALEALEARKAEDRLADERSATERAVLQVLAENRGPYLRRGMIYEKLTLPEKGLTPARVGQILVELYEEGLLLRENGRAQGNPNAAFYALSPRGLELCRNLELVPETLTSDARNLKEGKGERSQEKEGQVSTLPHLLDQALSTLFDPCVPAHSRGILAGLIANLDPTPAIRSRLQYWLAMSPRDATTQNLLRSISTSWDRLAPATYAVPGSPEDQELLKARIDTAVKMCEAWMEPRRGAISLELGQT